MIDPKPHVAMCEAEFAAGRASREAEVESMRRQIEWVRGVTAAHGYDGLLAPGCCPLAEWLDERESLRQQLEWVKTTYKELKSRVHSPSGYLEQIAELRRCARGES